ncbi:MULTISPECIES: MerR family transcriptional regulator [Ralstonia]|jgi:DNA-binding transcriptional MerR regulator|uniref:Putative transcriptional regulator n=1 Tax=Ralstonia pickettii OR214 TaxID=1264675 RepID=R0DYV2_RALPI|nr:MULTISPECIES: MerR family transcriptional regulator [Ralstonia]ENZ75119.1 putative transcriptional regulator [Ralstonia pickettii OR214]MCM3582602.1 MerR family transcriptional regulator [Ralstonia pickettii]MDR9382769.1 MerR family transcriptional regulator [Ralstonia sp. 11b]
MAERDPARLLIGALAERTGRSIHTIRWYETQGLIPGVARDAAVRRVYTEQHVNWLELMERLRSSGMSVAQMREYTALVCEGRSTLKARHELLVAHRAQVTQTIAEWTRSLALIDSKIDFYGERVATGTRPARESNLPQARALAKVATREDDQLVARRYRAGVIPSCCLNALPNAASD